MEQNNREAVQTTASETTTASEIAVASEKAVPNEAKLTAWLRSIWNNHRSLVIAILLGLVLSLAHLAASKQSPAFSYPILDAFDYVRDAQVTLGRAPAAEPYYHSPLYVWLLAATFKL